MTISAEDLVKSFGNLPPHEFDKLAKMAQDVIGSQIWIPNAGPQTQAYYCLADWLLYGGQGGGGKTDLDLGLAFTQHQRSLINRRKYANLDGIIDRALEIYGSRKGYNGSPPPRLTTADGRIIQFAGCQHSGDETDWQGVPFDLKCFDEAVQFLESQIRLHLGWLRSVDVNQRCRAVLSTNPPIDASGDWIIGMFRPWLDLTHHNPAEPGELRWYIVDGGRDYEVDGPEPIERDGDVYQPLSRTFIPAALKDNPYLVRTDYQKQLDALPGHVRLAVRDGNFMASRQDQENQVIPLDWWLAAEARWDPHGGRGVPMTAVGYDASGGGIDPAALAMRHDGWYAPIEILEGPAAADGVQSATFILTRRRDNAAIVIDVGGGYGGSTIERFKDNDIPYTPFNGANAGFGRSLGGNLQFANKRAEAIWRFREALDPNQPGGSVIALPPDTELRSEATAPTFTIGLRGILIESKDDIKEKIGRSTNRFDAVVQALSEGQEAVIRGVTRRRSERKGNLPSHAKMRGGPLGRRLKKKS